MPEFPKIEEVSKEPPPPPMLFTNSATIEALMMRLEKSNSAGIGYIRDEAAGLIEELNKPGREGDRSFLLEGIDGGSYKTLRVGRGETYVPRVAVPIAGTIQPDRLQGLVNDGLHNTKENDGLLPRFFATVYPDPRDVADIKFVNRAPKDDALKKFYAVVERIHGLDYRSPATYTFDAAAQKLYGEWAVFAERYRRTTEMPGILASHLSKYDGFIPTIAMLFMLADKYDGDGTGHSNKVGVEYLRMAFRWAWFLERHARRVYHLRVSPARAAAQALATKIQRGRLKTDDGVFTLKSVYENDWVGLSTPDDARDALRILAHYDWVRELSAESSKRGGRPSERYALNPLVTAEHPKVGELVTAPNEGFEGGGLVPAYFGREEEENAPLNPLPSKPRKTPSKRSAEPVRAAKYTRAGSAATTRSRANTKGGRR